VTSFFGKPSFFFVHAFPYLSIGLKMHTTSNNDDIMEKGDFIEFAKDSFAPETPSAATAQEITSTPAPVATYDGIINTSGIVLLPRRNSMASRLLMVVACPLSFCGCLQNFHRDPSGAQWLRKERKARARVFEAQQRKGM
jgi:hypothetical protein